jgi:hypothetical protein
MDNSDFVLRQALRGDEVAFLAFLDRLEESGQGQDWRAELLKYARRYGLIGKQK